MLKISKKVRNGDLVTKHGDKYVRCGRHRAPVGVYQVGFQQTVIDYRNGQHLSVHVPTGIVIHGPVNVHREIV